MIPVPGASPNLELAIPWGITFMIGLGCLGYWWTRKIVVTAVWAAIGLAGGLYLFNGVP